MAYFRSSTPVRQTRDSARLMAYAQALDASGSRVEDRYWEGLITQVLTRLLRTGNDAPLEAALTRLAQENTGGYDVLVEQAETLSESATITHEGRQYDALLIVLPIAAWTRYQIAVGDIAPAHLDALAAQLHEHVLAMDTRLALFPRLVSIDQMPRSFSETWQWLQRLAQQALGAGQAKLVLPDEEDLAQLLADTRYVVGVVAVESGRAMFRWQEILEKKAVKKPLKTPVKNSDPALAAAANPEPASEPDAAPPRAAMDRRACEEQWIAQATPVIAELLPGCGFECLLPDAYYVSNRAADRRVRPLALQAAVAWLESVLGIPTSQLRAVLAACGDEEAEEYRIGFTVRQGNDVLYGCIWPVYERGDAPGLDAESGESGPEADIIERLKALGVGDVRRLAGLFPAEFCEETNTPYFPNPLGEMVHAEMPVGADDGPGHYH